MSNAWRWSRVTLQLLVCLLASRTPPVLAADHLEAIKKRGTLLWGADAEGGAPYVYPDPQKPELLVGFEYELAEALAAKLGVKAQMVQNQWDQLIPALERGNFDIILNGLELTAQRQQRIAMSRPYFIYAQQIVTPSAAASSNAWLYEVSACVVQADSGAPQLIDTTDGRRTVSCTAVVIASRNPWSVFGAKYTTIRAPLAIAPTTSMSSMTSPSAPLGSPVGAFRPRSTDTAVTDGVRRPRRLK